MISFIHIILAIFLGQNTEESNRSLQAAMFLGSRSAQTQRTLPVVKQVVFVPDEATYLDEISRWSTEERWPILFEAEPFASQFIRRFSPERVWRRNSVKATTQNKTLALERAVANAWDGNDSIESALTELKVPPAGVVFTNIKDPARLAAVALAAGRGQLLRFLDSSWGDNNGILSENKTTELLHAIEKELQATGVQYTGLGDTIDAITLCMSMPPRVEFSCSNDNPVALSDVVGRNENGKRYAWTGWIFGSRARTTYLAMCSLFLQRDQYWFCNTYPNSGVWEVYGVNDVQQTMKRFGIDSQEVDGTLSALQHAEVSGVTSDVMYFTSKGNADFLEMSDERTSPLWLPILDTPAALFFLHSWSLKTPSVATSVGGVWLSRGVYAYVGSSHEPMLTAFVPPILMLRKTMSLIPFLVAARWGEGEHAFAKPWRVNTIGDPLMLCPPVGAIVRKYKPVTKRGGYEDVTELAKTQMQNAIDKPNNESFTLAIQTLERIGKDSMVFDLWSIATKKTVIDTGLASAALPALFRLKKLDAFLWAFSLIQKPTRLERDMLWQLVGMLESTPLQTLIDNLRKPYELDDLIVIADRISSSRGRSAVLQIIDDALRTARGRNMRGLKRLRKEYGG
jgi:hypothetical protein